METNRTRRYNRNNKYEQHYFKNITLFIKRINKKILKESQFIQIQM